MKHSKLTTLLSGGAALLALLAIGSGTLAHADDTNKAAKKQVRDKDRTYAAEPTKVRFGEFKVVEIKATTLAAKYEKPANEKSAVKIDEMLQTQLKYIFPNLKIIPAGGEFTKGGERTLQISPSIEKIHIVSTGARIWGGVMAGGSDIVMHVDFRDSASGELIANPDFWKGNNAWSGSGSWGSTDNQIRDAVVAQFVNYAQLNTKPAP